MKTSGAVIPYLLVDSFSFSICENCAVFFSPAFAILFVSRFHVAWLCWNSLCSLASKSQSSACLCLRNAKTLGSTTMPSFCKMCAGRCSTKFTASQCLPTSHLLMWETGGPGRRNQRPGACRICMSLLKSRHLVESTKVDPIYSLNFQI